MNTFTIESNCYLENDINGFYHTDYVGMNKPGNPDYLNELKNDRHDFCKKTIKHAAQDLKKILTTQLNKALEEFQLDTAAICVMPRAKTSSSYSKSQLYFSKTVSKVVNNIANLEDGTDWIIRHKNTRTTHLYHPGREGKAPYIGITGDTCKISAKVEGKDIILVDDVYTKYVNVNEDALQALLDAGANSVQLFVVAKTKKRH